jgi:hypothetical protein
MKPTHLALAALILTGAAGAVWWQLGKNEGRQTGTATSPISEPSHRRAVKPARTSRFASLTDPSVRWQVRVDMLRRLEADSLGGEDIDTLYKLLNHRPAPGQEENWWIIVNEIMEQMRKQAIAPERYGKEMLAIIRNPEAAEVLRDYAVQHLGQWISPRGQELGIPREQNTGFIREALPALGYQVADPALAHTSIPGTTLAVLADMRAGGLGDEALAPVIRHLDPWFRDTLGGKNEVSKVTRVSAINAVGTLGLTQYLPLIRRGALEEAGDASFRLCSIAALGDLGHEEDIPALESLASGYSKFRFAAQTALTKCKIANSDEN